MEGATPAGYGV